MAEIAVPMIGSTVTTIVVFVPMALLSGVTGAFFIALSITLATALALSLFFALFITPLFSAYFLRPPRGAGPPRHPGALAMNWLLQRYEPGLRWLLRRPIVAFAAAGVILAMTALIGSGLGSDFLPDMDEGAFEFNFTMPPGTSLTETDRALKQAESVIAGNPNVLAYARLTGLDPSGFFPAPPNAGNIRATLLERNKRKDGIDTILDDIRRDVSARVPILKFTITQILQDLLNDLSNTPATIEIKIFGNDEARLERIAEQIDARIVKVRGVVDDFNGIVYSTPNILVKLKPLAGSRAGFTTSSLTAAVQAGFDGIVATTIPRLPVPVPVRIRYDTSWNDLSLRDLQTLPVVAPNGATYSLGALANVVTLGSTTERNEENLQQIVRVTANVSGRDLGGTIADIRSALADLKLPAGYRLVYGGRYALQQQSFSEFGTAIAVAILLVFITMVFEFRGFRIPIVVISSVPLALFGVVVALRITSIPLNVSSFMGLILLVGSVVKNGILLFDEVDKLIANGAAPETAMVQAGRLRMRPIIMTTLTSLLGVVPLALGLGAGSEMQKPLAVATIGGLIFSRSSRSTSCRRFTCRSANNARLPTQRLYRIRDCDKLRNRLGGDAASRYDPATRRRLVCVSGRSHGPTSLGANRAARANCIGRTASPGDVRTESMAFGCGRGAPAVGARSRPDRRNAQFPGAPRGDGTARRRLARSRSAESRHHRSRCGDCRRAGSRTAGDDDAIAVARATEHYAGRPGQRWAGAAPHSRHPAADRSRREPSEATRRIRRRARARGGRCNAARGATTGHYGILCARGHAGANVRR